MRHAGDSGDAVAARVLRRVVPVVDTLDGRRDAVAMQSLVVVRLRAA